MINDDMNEENFTTKQCVNCSGYGSKGKPPYRVICPTCKGTGIIIIDNMTGKLIVNDDYENKDCKSSNMGER